LTRRKLQNNEAAKGSNKGFWLRFLCYLASGTDGNRISESRGARGDGRHWHETLLTLLCAQLVTLLIKDFPCGKVITADKLHVIAGEDLPGFDCSTHPDRLHRVTPRLGKDVRNAFRSDSHSSRHCSLARRHGHTKLVTFAYGVSSCFSGDGRLGTPRRSLCGFTKFVARTIVWSSAANLNSTPSKKRLTLAIRTSETIGPQCRPENDQMRFSP